MGIKISQNKDSTNNSVYIKKKSVETHLTSTIVTSV